MIETESSFGYPPFSDVIVSLFTASTSEKHLEFFLNVSIFNRIPQLIDT